MSEGGTDSRRRWVVAIVLIVAAGAAGLWLGTRQRDTVPDDAPERPPTLDELPPDTPTEPASLYFPSSNGRLYAETRDFPKVEPALRAKALLEALLAGPSAEALEAPLPQGSRIETVYMHGTTAVLDLRPPEPETDAVGPPSPAERRQRRLSMGSTQELLALYSLVDTVVLGVEGIDDVRILWDGRQPETFAGHVDTTRPLAADPSLIAAN